MQTELVETETHKHELLQVDENQEVQKLIS